MNLFVGYEYMTWNYRVVKYSDGSGYGLHEIYYDDDGVEISMTKAPASFAGETPEKLQESITRAMADMLRRPIFNEPKSWTKTT